MELTRRAHGADGESTYTFPPISQHTQGFRGHSIQDLDGQLQEFMYGLAVRVVTMTAYYAPEGEKPHKLLVVFEKEK